LKTSQDTHSATIPTSDTRIANMSDNELDAELLALAGSDSSDEEGEAEVSEHFDDRSPTPELKQSVEKSADNGPRRGVAQKVRAKRGSKARRRQDSDDEDADM
jgi:RNA polymerase-associated protein RTF1